MSDIRNDYRAQKEQTIHLIDGLSEVTALVYAKGDGADVELERRLKAYEDRKAALERKEFSMVVIGEMKHGKSTFLNAMLRKPVFPKDVREATAAVTFLRHNDTVRAEHPEWCDKAVVEFNGRPTMVVAHEDLGKYTTCLYKGEINVAEDVRQVTIYTDSPFVQDGVTVVDTPGTNTPNGRHEEITYDQIERSNAAIFLFKAGEAGKKSDFEFLETTAKKIDRFFFVVNRIDEIGGIGPDSDRVIEDIKTKGKTFPTLKPILENDRFRFFPTSGLQALLARAPKFFPNEKYRDEASWEANCGSETQRQRLEHESGMMEFEEALLNFLFKGERTREFLKGHVEYVRKQTEDAARFIQEQMDVKNVSLEELQQKVALLESEYEREKAKLATASGAMTEKLEAAMKDFVSEKETVAKTRITELVQRVDEILDYDILQGQWSDLIASFNQAGSRFSSTVQMDLKDVVQGVFRSVDYRLRGELNKRLGQAGVLAMPELMPIEITCVVPKEVAQEVSDKLSKLEDELAGVEETLAKTDKATFEYEEAKLRQQELERERAEARSEIDRNLQMLGKRPEIGQRLVSEAGYEEVERGGAFGWLGDVLFGPKQEWHDAQYVQDDTAQRRYDEAHAKLCQKANEIEAAQKKKLAEMRGKLTEAQLKDAERRAAEQLHAKKKEQELKLRNRLREEQQKAKEQALTQAKSLFKRQVQNGFDAVMDQLRQTASKCSTWADGYVGTIQAELSDAMTSRRDELDRLVEEKTAAEERAQEKERRLGEAQAKCTAILETCQSFETEIELSI